jgi:ribokinase
MVAAHDRNAAIFTFRGANALLEPKDLKLDAFEMDLVYVTGLSNASADCFPLIVAKAKAAGALVATNPGIRQLSARQAAFRDVIGQIDILALNRHEAGALVPWLVRVAGEGGPMLKAQPGEDLQNLPDLARRGFSMGGFELSLAGFMHALRGCGPKWVVITDGKDGAYIGAPQGLIYCPTLPVTVAGTAGAGDAFASTFAAFVAGGSDAAQAALAATANAASVIQHLDTQTGLLRRSTLDADVARMRATVKVRTWAV